MDAADAADATTALQALQQAAAGRMALLVLDDVWQAQHFGKLSGFLDAATPSRTVVTTRVQGLVPLAVEVALGLLAPEEAARLLLSVAGMPTAAPHSEFVLGAARACGGLPLALSVAGGMLQDQFGGVADAAFVAVLTEDHGEALREGEFGDEMVSVEDRLITSSLRGYVGAERRQVMALFELFACFPEDVPVPTTLFDRLAMAAPPLFGMGAGTKRPHLKVRSWLTGLKKLSLLLGTMLDGFFMHDIVRDYAPRDRVVPHNVVHEEA